MRMYRFAVTETRNFEVEYVVEAETEEEAREKAESGETVSEEEIGLTGVSDRYVAELLSTQNNGSGDDAADNVPAD